MSPIHARGRRVACCAALAAAGLVAAASATSWAAGHTANKSERTSKSGQTHGARLSLLGSWQVTVTFNSNPPPGLTNGQETALQGFGGGGVLSEFASATRTTGYGVWRDTDKRGGFAYTFHELEFAPDGTLVGYVVVHQTGRVSSDGQSYTSSGTGQLFSTAGDALAPPSATTTVGNRVTF
jgi:hypothetical protein